MFGYVICNKSGLSEEELERYQNVYCGLCKALKTRFGQLERISLSYDMTFLAIFLTSLYEPQEQQKEFRCKLHPLHMKTAIENKYIDYAADMTVALAYFKCLDDWEDEKSQISRKYGDVLKKGYLGVKERYPRQCEMVEKSIRELSKVEKSLDSKPDDAVNCSGMMMSELFVYEEDFWSNSLRVFGYELGRFIYLMDASVDYKKDIKNGSYNPLVRMQKKPEEMEDILSLAIGHATMEAEKLPLVQDIHLIRNILYGGVWQTYYAKVLGKEKSHD